MAKTAKERGFKDDAEMAAMQKAAFDAGLGDKLMADWESEGGTKANLEACINGTIAERQQAGAMMLAEFDEEGGAGFENTDSSSYAIPFFRVLQSMSKQCKRANAEYVEGAKEGDFYNTVTGELFDGAKGVNFIPVHFNNKFLEWAGTVDEGGGLVGQHDMAAGQALLAKCTRDDDGNDRLENGHIVQDVREHFGIVIHPVTGAPMAVVLSLASTQIKKSKKFMSQMGALKRQPTQPKPDPMYSHVYKLTTVPEKKDQFDFYGIKIDHICGIENPVAGQDNNMLYKEAKNFREMITSGRAKVVDDAEGSGPGF